MRRTYEFGKRVESSWHMSEADAAYYEDADKIEGTEEIRTPTRIDRRLHEIAAEVRAGNVYPVPWELFRFER